MHPQGARERDNCTPAIAEGEPFFYRGDIKTDVTGEQQTDRSDLLRTEGPVARVRCVSANVDGWVDDIKLLARRG